MGGLGAPGKWWVQLDPGPRTPAEGALGRGQWLRPLRPRAVSGRSHLGFRATGNLAWGSPLSPRKGSVGSVGGSHIPGKERAVPYPFTPQEPFPTALERSDSPGRGAPTCSALPHSGKTRDVGENVNPDVVSARRLRAWVCPEALALWGSTPPSPPGVTGRAGEGRWEGEGQSPSRSPAETSAKELGAPPRTRPSLLAFHLFSALRRSWKHRGRAGSPRFGELIAEPDIDLQPGVWALSLPGPGAE